jgi:hypothetical protein
MHEVSHTPLLHPWLLELPDEYALGAPHRREVEEQPDVRRQPHPPRVGEALGVQDHDVNRRLHLPQSPNDRGYLPERQQPRHVRELKRRLEPLHLHDREPGEVEHGDRGVGPVPLRRDVRPGNVAHAPEVKRRSSHDPRSKLPLQSPRLRRRQAEPV